MTRKPEPDRGAASGDEVFGDLRAAAEAFESLPCLTVVTDGPELRMVAFNAGARAATQDRMVHGQPILETFSEELVGQGWPEAYRIPTETGRPVRIEEARIQLHQPDGTIDEMYLDCDFVPRLDADGRPRGTISITHDVTDRVRRRQEAELENAEMRQRYAAALGNVREMQAALLPASVPVSPGFDIAARYVLGSDESSAGGDWFDAVAREDGSVVLAVGDVVGHGQQAAVAMGQLRSVLLAQLQAEVDLLDAVRLLDHFAGTLPGGRRATVCVAHVDPTGTVEYVTAGHPPPLVLADQRARCGYLAPSGASPLGTGATLALSRAHLGDDETLVLYTDGLLERPGTDTDAAAVELLQTALDARRNILMPDGAPASAAERVCSLSIELLTRLTGHADDITILAAQRRPAVADLHLTLPTAATSIAEARRAATAWADRCGAGHDHQGRIALAVTELVSNVVDHAYLGRSTVGPLELRAHLSPGGVAEVEVTDSLTA